MEPGSIIELNEDVVSHAKGRIYARRGERARVVKLYDNVLIVETKKDFRFPVRVEKVKPIIT